MCGQQRDIEILRTEPSVADEGAPPSSAFLIGGVIIRLLSIASRRRQASPSMETPAVLHTEAVCMFVHSGCLPASRPPQNQRKHCRLSFLLSSRPQCEQNSNETAGLAP